MRGVVHVEKVQKLCFIKVGIISPDSFEDNLAPKHEQVQGFVLSKELVMLLQHVQDAAPELTQRERGDNNVLLTHAHCGSLIHHFTFRLGWVRAYSVVEMVPMTPALLANDMKSNSGME